MSNISLIKEQILQKKLQSADGCRKKTTLGKKKKYKLPEL